MIKTFKSNDLGHFKLDWLDSKHHFSFGEYHDAKRMGFGTLRVVNDDLIKGGQGFGFHPHRDMEIITYVRTGAVLHRDSLGNEGRTRAGDVQVMSAGTGIIHAEFAEPGQDTTLFQIWIKPRAHNLPPRWEQAEFPQAPVTEDLNLLVSGRAEDTGKGALMINQDAAIYGGTLTKGTKLLHGLKGPTYVVMSEGRANINGTVMDKGDGAEVENETGLTIEALDDTTLLVIEV